MNLAINLIGTTNESGSKTYCMNFFSNLISSTQLKNYKKITIFISRSYLKKTKINKYQGNIEIIAVNNIFCKGLFKIIYDQFFFPFQTILHNSKIIFCPMNYCPLIFFLLKKKIILGIHSNLIWYYPELSPGNFLKQKFIKFLMTKSVNLANKIIFCSKTSKNELKKKLNINNKKIYHVYLGCDHIKKSKILKKNKKNILINSSIVRYHNIMLIFKALVLLKKKKIKIPKVFFLTQILDKEYYLELIDFIKKQNLNKDITFLDNVPNNLTTKFYEKSLFSINSSFIESFGFPSLESMRRNCPVILSKYQTFKEINKNAALYFKQGNLKQLCNCIRLLINSNSKRNFLIKKGQQLSNQYTWKKTVNETLKIVSKV